MLKLCKISAYPNQILGLHLSRAPWDPYPWVSDVQLNSSAFISGICIGDIILELNGNDIIGQKISQLADKIHKHWDDGGNDVEFLIWRNNKIQENNTINQHSLQKFATCLQNIAQLLECPICLEVVKPPGWQCCNGHVLCNSCRGRTVKCPICRVTLGPKGRCLLSDKLFTLLSETFPCDVRKYEDETNNNKIKQQQKDFNKNKKLNKNNENHSNNNCRTTSTTTTTSSKGFEIGNEKQVENIKVNNYYSNKMMIPKQSKSIQNEENKITSRYKKFILSSLTSSSSSLSSSSFRYYCPIGKLFSNNNDSPCILVIKENNNENFKMYIYLDILTHLRRVHQISVIQYCGTYNERIHVELMNKNVISCISIFKSTIKYQKDIMDISTLELSESISSSSSTSSSSSSISLLSNKNSSTNVLVSSSEEIRNEHDSKLNYCKHFHCHHHVNHTQSNLYCSSIAGNSMEQNLNDEIHKISKKIPDSTFNTCIHCHVNQQNHSKSSNSSSSSSSCTSSRNNSNCNSSCSSRSSSFRCKCYNNVNNDDEIFENSLSSFDINNEKAMNEVEIFFIAQIPIDNNEENHNGDCEKNYMSCSCSTNKSNFIGKSSNVKSKNFGNLYLSHSNDNNRCKKIQKNIHDNIRNISNFSNTYNDICDDDDGNGKIKNTNLNGSNMNRKGKPIGDLSFYNNHNEQKYAIFIWYCGNEINVKKFKAVIECTNTGNKWNAFIHPLTKSWNLVQSQNEFHELNFNFVNFLNIVISINEINE